MLESQSAMKAHRMLHFCFRGEKRFTYPPLDEGLNPHPQFQPLEIWKEGWQKGIQSLRLSSQFVWEVNIFAIETSEKNLFNF